MDKTWLTSSKYSGTGTSTVSLTATANHTGHTRSTTITAKDSKGKTAVCTVSQPTSSKQLGLLYEGKMYSASEGVYVPDCIGCSACESYIPDAVSDVCPYGATIILEQDSGHISLTLPNECIACGSCNGIDVNTQCPANIYLELKSGIIK